MAELARGISVLCCLSALAHSCHLRALKGPRCFQYAGQAGVEGAVGECMRSWSAIFGSAGQPAAR